MDLHTIHGNIYEDENGKLSIACKCCDLRFEDSNRLREHVSETKAVPDPNIPELPVECLTKIFKYLAPNQLVVLTKVCRDFKALAEKVMELYFDPGPIDIVFDRIAETTDENDDFFPTLFDDIEDKNVGVRARFPQYSFFCRSKYEVAFPSSIRRLLTIVDSYAKLFQFIRENCCTRIMSLVILDGVVSCDSTKDRRIYGRIAKDQLKHLKHLKLQDVTFHCLYDQLLQYTNQLEFLNVVNLGGEDCNSDRLCARYDFAWTNRIYPHLEKVFLRTVDNQFDLMPMIERHPKLRSVACNSLATIKSILKSDIKFNYISLIFSHRRGQEHSDFKRLHKEIVKFGQSNRFETFELCLDGLQGLKLLELLDLINEIPNVTGLHADDSIIHFYDPDPYLADRQISLPLIEKLCIFQRSPYTACDTLSHFIDEQFPNLKELRIISAREEDTFNRIVTTIDFKEFAQAILYDAQAFQNLKQLHYEKEDEVVVSWDDVVEINFIRSKRLNPSKITVYLDPMHFHKFNKNVVELQFINLLSSSHGFTVGVICGYISNNIMVRWSYRKVNIVFIYTTTSSDIGCYEHHKGCRI